MHFEKRRGVSGGRHNQILSRQACFVPDRAWSGVSLQLQAAHAISDAQDNRKPSISCNRGTQCRKWF